MSDQKFNVGGVTLEQPFKLRRLGHVGLFLEELPAAQAFYEGQLGFRLTDLLVPGPGAPTVGLFLTYGADHHSVVCIDGNLVKGKDPAYDAGMTVNQLSFQVGTLEEMVRGYRFLKERDVSIWRVGRDFPGSNWAVYGRDPDGFLVELYYGMEQIGWDRRSKPAAMHRRTEEEPELPQLSEIQEIWAAEGEEDPASSSARPAQGSDFTWDVGGILMDRPFSINKIGPAHLFVEDVEISARFYTEMMGLTIVEEVIFEGERIVFLRVGTDHHAIGLYPIRLRERFGFSATTRLMHLCVELSSYRQLRDAAAFLDAAGLKRGPVVPQAMLPGIDHNVSFLDPAGHAVLLYFSMEQIGWDGCPRPASQRRVVDAEWPETLVAMSDTYADQTKQGPIS